MTNLHHDSGSVSSSQSQSLVPPTLSSDMMLRVSQRSVARHLLGLNLSLWHGCAWGSTKNVEI
jgi:hypothetical protein